MKPSTKRTLKKLFLNITSVLFAVVLTGNVIAGENAGQINQFLGTKTSETISTLPAGQEETYARYFESKYSLIVNPCECPEEERSREIVFILFKNIVLISLIWELSYGSLQIFFGKKQTSP